jgi:hypothetical protein
MRLGIRRGKEKDEWKGVDLEDGEKTDWETGHGTTKEQLLGGHGDSPSSVGTV